MAAYSLSGKAVSDLDGIYEFTILNFGQEQAQAYLLGLHTRMDTKRHFGETDEHRT